MNMVQRALLALLGPLAPHLALGNGLKPAWISRDAAPARAPAHTCYPQMAHEIFNEPERELPLTELTRWLAALPLRRATAMPAETLE
ncbi:MAG: hypothetical protein F9K36_03590 [Burkholderiaceae bacterium]|nr:MAG: hypothetical protein F9K36_03590 [Burkholderiaceae bacterium]